MFASLYFGEVKGGAPEKLVRLAIGSLLITK